MSLQRRLEDLERRPPRTRESSEARRQMIAHLGRVAMLRRGELSPEKAAEVEAENAVAESRLASMRGEGRS